MTEENPQIMQLIARGMGYGFVCGNCTKLWAGLSAGHGACMAAVQGKTCAGPMKNMGFPEYEGPLKGNLVQFCFVCGKGSDYAAVTMHGMVGVCAKHQPLLNSCTAGDEAPRFLTGDEVETVKG